jgi:outer membrane murein-binding lipoprotein Lpp
MKKAKAKVKKEIVVTVWGVVFAAAVCAMILVGGCEKSQNTTTATGNTKIISEEMGLKARVEQLQKENEQFKQQVETLSMLPVKKRAEAIYKIERVDIGRFTNIYKEDGGAKESLVVYVQPVDETGDAIKAAGAVEVQLWDLNKPESQAMIGQWKVEPNELKKIWFDSIAMTGYRLAFDVTGKVDKAHMQLTVKMTFTDYLSGKVFTEQKTIKP